MRTSPLIEKYSHSTDEYQPVLTAWTLWSRRTILLSFLVPYCARETPIMRRLKFEMHWNAIVGYDSFPLHRLKSPAGARDHLTCTTSLDPMAPGKPTSRYFWETLLSSSASLGRYIYSWWLSKKYSMNLWKNNRCSSFEMFEYVETTANGSPWPKMLSAPRTCSSAFTFTAIADLILRVGNIIFFSIIIWANRSTLSKVNRNVDRNTPCRSLPDSRRVLLLLPSMPSLSGARNFLYQHDLNKLPNSYPSRHLPRTRFDVLWWVPTS